MFEGSSSGELRPEEVGGSDPPDGYADSHTSDDVSLIAEHFF